MTSLARFIYDDRPVRVVTIDGEPWFVGADVARVLGIAAASGITRMVDDEDRVPTKWKPLAASSP